jgi:hypothetical protein
MAAAQHVAPAEEAAVAAEKLAADARAELAAMEQQLEAAAKKVEEAEARAKQLEAELREFLPPSLEDAGRGPRTRSAGVLAAEGMVYVLRSDLDNTWRERCE